RCASVGNNEGSEQVPVPNRDGGTDQNLTNRFIDHPDYAKRQPRDLVSLGTSEKRPSDMRFRRAARKPLASADKKTIEQGRDVYRYRLPISRRVIDRGLPTLHPFPRRSI